MGTKRPKRPKQTKKMPAREGAGILLSILKGNGIPVNPK